MGAIDTALTGFFGTILAGESKSYNDHNYYVSGGKLKGYVENSWGTQYSLLKKPLSSYTVGEIIEFQNHKRDNIGQLWAVGRYQMIPVTLKSAVTKAGISLNEKFDKKTQDKLALQLINKRKAVKAYIYGEVPDTTENLNKAITQVAMEWSSVGVPVDMKGYYGNIKAGESYYKGGGDRSSVSPSTVGSALKKLRSAITGVKEVVEGVKSNKGVIGLLLIGIASWVMYRTYTKKPIIPKF